MYGLVENGSGEGVLGWLIRRVGRLICHREALPWRGVRGFILGESSMLRVSLWSAFLVVLGSATAWGIDVGGSRRNGRAFPEPMERSTRFPI